MSQRRLPPAEMKILEEVARTEPVVGNIRLREGEYQYSLVKAIASFELELMFPDVKDLIRRLFGEEKSSDLQFVRKIQTILKKMEKSNIVRILPKKNPWQLQRYALSSFKFRDSDKNLVVLATDQQVKQMQDLLHSALTQQEKGRRDYFKVLPLMLVVIASYFAVVWALTQPVINAVIFISGLFVSVTCSVILGEILSTK
ncbi:MAG: hypothetical protein ABSB28_02580 [Candidatus Bathyarchaeia archaeon]